MYINDITAIYYTANRIPDSFSFNVRKHLRETLFPLGIPVIGVSQKPLEDLERNICIGNIGMSVWNIYVQILAGAEVARTEYIALCEDDCLYSSSHFTSYRPIGGVDISFNRNRWNCRTWDSSPIFSFKERSTMSQIIARRTVFVEALKERIALRDISRTAVQEEHIQRYLGEPGRYDLQIGVTERKMDTFKSATPNVIFDHLYGMQSLHLAQRKKLGPLRSPELIYWGLASELVSKMLGNENENGNGE
jgi:hypothetical protein